MKNGHEPLTEGSPENFYSGESGATSTEYGMLVGFVSLGLTLAVGLFGTAVSDFYGRLVPEIEALFGTF